MKKFTIFTIILAVSVITVTADLVIREYYDSGAGVNILGTQVKGPQPVDEKTDAQSYQESENDETEAAAPQVEEQRAESEIESRPQSKLITPEPSPLNSDLIKQSGFTDVFDKAFEGKVFELLDVTNIPVTDISLYEMHAEGVPVASISEIALADEIRALQMYELLQNKTKPYIDLSLNETNVYGQGSFYINHAKKPDEAFLVIKLGKRIYSIAYLKFYHPEVKKLISLLSQ